MLAIEGSENQVLADLIGARVEIWTIGGDDDHYDTGILEAIEMPWLRLNMGRDRLFVFPIYNIRLIKVLDRPNQKTLSRTLLRPALPHQTEAKIEE